MAAMASTLGQWACKPGSTFPIIDTHQHLWDLEMLPLTWVKPPLDKSFVMKDYLAATEGQNVVKAIYMEVGAPEEYKKKEAEWALGLCEDPSNPTVGAVISANPGDSGFESFIGTFADSPYLKGIRCFFKSPEEMVSTRTIRSIQFLGDLNLSADLNLPPHLLNKGSQLVDACPSTRFILNHCGNADPVAFFPESKEKPRDARHDTEQWYSDMEMLAQRSNIICKISGVVDNVRDFQLVPDDLAPIVNHCHKAFGPDRIIFASDWPVCLITMPLAQWIETLKSITAQWPLEHRNKLFHDNAHQFYGLED